MSQGNLRFSKAAAEYLDNWGGEETELSLTPAVLYRIMQSAQEYAHANGHANIYIRDIQKAKVHHRVRTLTGGYQYRETPYTTAEQEQHRLAWVAASPHP